MNPLLRLFARNTETAISGLGLLADGAARGVDRDALLERVYRELHSLKSEAAFLGIGRVEHVCRDAELLLAQLRRGGGREENLAELARFRSRLIDATSGESVAQGNRAGQRITSSARPQRVTAGGAYVQSRAAESLRRAAEEAVRRGEQLYRVWLKSASQSNLDLSGQTDRLSRFGVVLGSNAPNALLFASRQDPTHLQVSGELRDLGFEPLDLRDLQRIPSSASGVDQITLSVRRSDLEMLTFLLEELRANPGMPERRRSAYLDRAVGLADNLGRMSFGDLVSQLQPHVTDLARAAGKRVELQVRGAEQEFSVGTAEVVSGILLHLLRNAVDHGVELPEERAARGKPRAGSIEVTAVPGDGWLTIGVSDDGAGVHGADPDAGNRATDLLSVISEPGYSTAGSHAVLSGRGLGLHIVQYSVDTILGGSLDLQTSPEKGTSFRFTVPQASRLLRVHICRSGDRLLAIPSSVVSGVTRLEDRLLSLGPGGRQFYRIRGTAAPILNPQHRETEPESVALVLSGLAGGYSLYLVDSVLSEELAVRDPGRRTVVYSEHAGANATLINPENVARQ